MFLFYKTINGDSRKYFRKQRIINSFKDPLTVWRFARFKRSIELLKTSGVLSFYKYSDGQWRVNAVNNAFVSSIGSSKKEIIGMTLLGLVNNFANKKFQEDKYLEIKTALNKSEEKKLIEMPYIAYDKEERTVCFRVDSQPFGKVVVMQDYTRATNLRNYLDLTKQHLEEALQELEKTNKRNYEYRNNLPIGALEVKADLLVSFANKRIKELLGYTDEDIQKGLNVMDVIAKKDRSRAIDNMKKRIAGKYNVPAKYDVSAKNDEQIPVEIFVEPVFNNKVEIISFNVSVLDLRERKKRKDELRKALEIAKENEQKAKESEERYKTIVAGLDIAYYETDIDGNITFANDSFCKIMKTAREKLLGRNYSQFIANHQEVFSVFNDVFRTRKPREKEIGWKMQPEHGQTIDIESSVNPILDPANPNKVIGFRGVFEDVTEKIKLEQELKKAANEDELTGAFTMRKFNYDLPDAIKRARRNKKKLALFTIDANNLKHTNDEFGHEHGDSLLKAIVDSVKDCVRREDHVYRRGGVGGADEFLVIMESISNECKVDAKDRMEAIIERLQQYAADYRQEVNVDIPFEAAFGYSYLDPIIDNLDDQEITSDTFLALEIDPAVLIEQLEKAKYIKKVAEDRYIIQSKFYSIVKIDDMEIDQPKDIKKKVKDLLYDVPGIYSSMIRLISDSDIAMYVAKRQSEKELEELQRDFVDDRPLIKKSIISFYKKDSEKKED